MLAFACALAGGAVAAVAAPAPARAQTAPADYALLDSARQGAYVKIGERGARVMALQRALNRAGAALWEDGWFGLETWKAVRALQTRSGLTADGVVGPATMRALDQALGLGGGGGSAPPAPPAPPTPPAPGPTTARIPARAAGAVGGFGFLQQTGSLSRAAREVAIERELLAGNVPAFLRGFRTVQVTARGGDGLLHTVSFRVAPDSLAIGADHDFVRIPMGAPTAQRVVDAFGCALPTRRMVDLIHQHADVKLTPQPLTPGAWMMSNDAYLTHHRRIEQQVAGLARGVLLAGHKKDVVVTNRIRQQPGRVAIYGWHWPSGAPIQPLSLVHERTYADYSHQVRLVDREVTVDGRTLDLFQVLADPVLAPLLSDEGVIASPRYPLP